MQITQTISETFPPKPTFTEADLPSLAGKTVLITGGAAGIGRELARMLYHANATVYIVGRNACNIDKARHEIIEKPLEGVDNSSSAGEIRPLVLDLSNLPTIKPAVDSLTRQISSIDVLFLNAGVMTPPPGSKTAQGHDLQLGTNVIGHFCLQQQLLPLLRSAVHRTGEARIIWVASDGSKSSPSPDGIHWENLNGEKPIVSPWALYAQSKAGNIIVATETARRFGEEGILVASLNPGHLQTELQRNMGACTTKLLNATLLYPARFGALTELCAGFSGVLRKENNGAYLIPWGRLGEMPEHIKAGLEKGSGKRLWTLLEAETEQYC